MKKRILKKGLAGLMVAVMLLGTSGNAVFADWAPEKGIFSMEFDGNDSTDYWMTFASNRNPSKPSNFNTVKSQMKDGILEITPNAFSYGTFGAYFNPPLDVTNKEKMIFEVRFKRDLPDKTSTDVLPDDSNLFLIQGETTNYQVNVLIKDGCFAYGGKEGTGGFHVSNYKLYDETWYTMRLVMKFTDKTGGDANAVMTGYIVESNDPDNPGEEYQGPANQYAYGWNLPRFDKMTFPMSDSKDKKCYIDYVRLWDDSFNIMGTDIKDKAKNVAADTVYTINLSGAVNENTVKNAEGYSLIIVEDSEQNVVPTQAEVINETKVQLYFPAGLKYNETYTVKIPDTVESTANEKLKGKEYTFTTEDTTYDIGSPTASISANKATASVKVVNNTASDREIYILTAVYSNGVLAKLVSEKVAVPKGNNKKVSATPLDVTGIEKVTAKAYVWNGVAPE